MESIGDNPNQASHPSPPPRPALLPERRGCTRLLREGKERKTRNRMLDHGAEALFISPLLLINIYYAFSKQFVARSGAHSVVVERKVYIPELFTRFV